MANDVYWRTDEYPRIEMLQWIPPGYKIARMTVSKKGSELFMITFAMSPSSFSESRQNNVQMTKTNGGWFLQRLGPNPISLNFDGYMLDTEGYLEKHKFLENWKKYIEDSKSGSMEYKNEYSVSFSCMGRAYYGYMQSINFSAAAVKPFLHQYTGNFVALSDEFIYKPNSDAKIQMELPAGTKVGQKVLSASTRIYQILNRR